MKSQRKNKIQKNCERKEEKNKSNQNWLKIRNKIQGSKNGVTSWNILVTHCSPIDKYRYVNKINSCEKKKIVLKKMKLKISQNVALKKIVKKNYKKKYKKHLFGIFLSFFTLFSWLQ